MLSLHPQRINTSKMLFNSIEFALFLPVVFILYWILTPSYSNASGATPRYSIFRYIGKNISTDAQLRIQNLFIVIASYIFYGWWDWRFLLLIAFTSLCSWASGLLIKRYSTDATNCAIGGADYQIVTRKRVGFNWSKFYLISNIVLNLLILGFFKYYNFFVESFVDAFALCGVTLHASTLQIILPVGISFYTFQALSYSIDIYRRKLDVCRDPVAFFAHVSFFPQLVAGPIERATNLLPQMQKPRTFNYEKAVDGCRQMLWGLFKKIVIADNCAVYVNEVFANYQNQSGSTLLLAAIFFTFQIYGDFSGYSDIAIGCAKLFGIDLMQNFRYPYFSRDIAEFWRRWHISLTTWFRDYIYIPLGGSRTTKAKVIRNTFIIFLVSGFWHGANWTFVAWGAYHAFLFLPLILLGKNRRYTDTVAEGRILPSLKETFQMLTTFMLAVIGWIIFRAESITQAWEYMCGMCDASMFSVPWLKNRLFYIPLLFSIMIMYIVEWISRDYTHILYPHKKYIRWFIFEVLIGLIMIFGGGSSEFIYFQF